MDNVAAAPEARFDIGSPIVDQHAGHRVRSPAGQHLVFAAIILPAIGSNAAGPRPVPSAAEDPNHRDPIETSQVQHTTSVHHPAVPSVGTDQPIQIRARGLRGKQLKQLRRGQPVTHTMPIHQNRESGTANRAHQPVPRALAFVALGTIKASDQPHEPNHQPTDHLPVLPAANTTRGAKAGNLGRGAGQGERDDAAKPRQPAARPRPPPTTPPHTHTLSGSRGRQAEPSGPAPRRAGLQTRTGGPPGTRGASNSRTAPGTTPRRPATAAGALTRGPPSQPQTQALFHFLRRAEIPEACPPPAVALPSPPVRGHSGPAVSRSPRGPTAAVNLAARPAAARRRGHGAAIPVLTALGDAAAASARLAHQGHG